MLTTPNAGSVPARSAQPEDALSVAATGRRIAAQAAQGEHGQKAARQAAKRDNRSQPRPERAGHEAVVARPALPEERPAVLDVLQSAFHDDPLYRWLYPSRSAGRFCCSRCSVSSWRRRPPGAQCGSWTT
jgi:hypothetical protein